MKVPSYLSKLTKNVSFYCSSDNSERFYAEFTDAKKIKNFVPMDSQKFLSHIFSRALECADDDDIPTPESIVKILTFLLISKNNFKHAKVFNRVSGNLFSGNIEYDLGNIKGESVKTDASGWSVSAPKNGKFIFTDTNLPQVTPSYTSESPLELLAPFFNLTGDNYILFVVWLIQSFSRGSHHALLIFAERGSGKTTFSKMIKKILDPGKFDVTTIPTTEDSLRVLLQNTLLCTFDNVSNISDSISDLFCGAITGTAIVTRSLYTNNSTNVATLHNIIVINGIGVVPERDDLAERMLIMPLHKLSETELKLDEDVWTNFENQLPFILGSIFNTLSVAMQKIQDIVPQKLPRMADSFIEMLAIALALGISESEFRRIYNANKRQLEAARIGSPLVTAVKEFMTTISGRKYSASAQDVFTAVHSAYSGDKALLPASASHFSKRLDKEFSNLLKAGFRVNIDDTGAKGTIVTIIKKK